MFAIFKKLLKDTAVYGLSTIVGRLLNYMLVPFYTRIFLPDEYGVITELYAYVGFFLTLLTFGLETGYFRFNESLHVERKLFSSLFYFLLLASSLFVFAVISFMPEIASVIDYSKHSEYIVYLTLIIALDVVSALPFARLRYLNKAFLFAGLKIASIVVNILFNVFFYVLLPYLISAAYFDAFTGIFTGLDTVKYVFISNLISSFITIVLLFPQLRVLVFRWDFSLLKKVLWYSYPLLLVGFTGMAIESLDKVLLKHFISVPETVANASSYVMAEIGIYGANYKLAVFMLLFIQAYRFASEPIFFKQAKDSNAKEIYAAMMKYFIIFGLFIFLGIMLYLDIVKLFIDDAYFAGLSVVPVLLLAKLFYGIVFNLSIWYKLSNKTHYGIWVTLSGLFVSVFINVVFIPEYSYQASAWAAFAAYFVMAVLSWWLSLGRYEINYPFLEIGFYFFVTFSIFIVYKLCVLYIGNQYHWLSSLLIVFFLLLIMYKERGFRLLRRN